MSDSKTITLAKVYDASLRTHGSGHVFELMGDSPGGKRLKIEVKFDADWWLGALGDQLHKALKERESEMARIRLQLEGKA